MNKLKKAWKSWTIRFNTAVVAFVAGLPMLADTIPQIKDYLPENTYKALMLAVVVGNILLRFKTNSSLADK